MADKHSIRRTSQGPLTYPVPFSPYRIHAKMLIFLLGTGVFVLTFVPGAEKWFDTVFVLLCLYALYLVLRGLHFVTWLVTSGPNESHETVLYCLSRNRTLPRYELVDE